MVWVAVNDDITATCRFLVQMSRSVILRIPRIGWLFVDQGAFLDLEIWMQTVFWKSEIDSVWAWSSSRFETFVVGGWVGGSGGWPGWVGLGGRFEVPPIKQPQNLLGCKRPIPCDRGRKGDQWWARYQPVKYEEIHGLGSEQDRSTHQMKYVWFCKLLYFECIRYCIRFMTHLSDRQG